MCAVIQHGMASLHRRGGQTSAAFIQLCSSNGTMLPMLTWAPLTLLLRVVGKCGGHVTNAQMTTCITRRQLSIAGAMVVVVLSVAAAKCASTTPWQPKLPWWQLNGTMKQMKTRLTMWKQTANSLLVGCVVCVATGGVQHPTSGSTKSSAAAQSALTKQGARSASSTQPLRSVNRRNKAVLAQWDHERNAPQGNYPHTITLQSAKRIFWLCHKCPAGQEHSWSASPLNRIGPSKSGCPIRAGKAACRRNSLQALYPKIAAKWDHAKNEGQPDDHTANSTYLAWWSTLSVAAGSNPSINAKRKRIQRRLGSAGPS